MFDQYISRTLAFIEQAPNWAFWIVVAITFFESMAFIGMLVPGWLLLVGVGALVGSGVLPFYSMILAMFVGAVLGEGLSYYLGFHYRDNIRHWRLVQKHQTTLERCDRFIAEYGALSLVVGRFIGPVRAVLPVIAGVSAMPQSYFWIVNVLSAVLWAPLYLLPGVLVGAAISLPPGSQETLVVAAGTVVLFGWLARRWWVQGRQQQIAAATSAADGPSAEHFYLRSGLAILCLIATLTVLALSEIGRALLKVLATVLSTVA